MGKATRREEAHLPKTLGRVGGGLLAEALSPNLASTIELAGPQTLERLLCLIIRDPMTGQLLADHGNAVAGAPTMDQRLGESLIREQSPGLQPIEQSFERLGLLGVRG